MKKFSRFFQKVNIFFLAFLFVVSVTFCCPMDAKAAKKRITFTAGEDCDAFWYLYSESEPLYFYPTPSAGGLMGGVPVYNSWSGYNRSASGYSEADPIIGYYLTFSSDNVIPADSDLVVNFISTINCPSGVPSVNLTSNTLIGSIVNPSGVTQSSSITSSKIDTHTLQIKVTCNLHLPVATNSIRWKFFQFYVTGIPAKAAYSVTFDSFTAYYEIDETEKDILEDIRNNTDKTNEKLDNLTDGFQNDGMDSSKSDLDSSLADIEGAEGSLFNPAKSQLDAYEFTDISAMQGVVTGVGFVSTFLQSFYTSSGGLDGLGIITAVGFSVMLVSIVIGLYRHFTK